MKKIYSISKDINSDTITPISVYLNLRDLYSNVSLFESSDYHSKENSKSFICLDPIATIKVNNKEITTICKKEFKQRKIKNLDTELTEEFNYFDFENSDLHPYNGFFGAVSYDTIPYFETIKFKEKNRFNEVPEIYFSAYQYIIVFDNFKNRAKLISNGFDEKKLDFEELNQALLNNSSKNFSFKVEGGITSSDDPNSFQNKVQIAKEHVLKGDVFQLVLSRAFEQKYQGDDFEVYRQLRALNPSPYMFYFDLDNAKLIGASPEAQLKVKNGLAEIHPIAGTVKRRGNIEADQLNMVDLAKDKKENAEHTMLVDLARNDLNISCKNVAVKEFKVMQSFSHVIHMVSKVVGDVADGDSLHSFHKSFPAGTLSGAPKFKAMELIDKYEAQNRGFYGGAIGQVCPNGDLNMAIIIRSCLSYKKTLYYQAGAGIVLDSIPENESQEVFNKVAAVEDAIQLANQEK